MTHNQIRHFCRVAIAAVAALFLFAAAASPARAAIVKFAIDPDLSFQTWTQTIDASELAAGVYVTTPQVDESDVTSLSGWLFVDLVPGVSIKLGAIPGDDTIDYGLGAPGFGGVPGLFAPLDPITSDPPFPAVGVQPGSNYGLVTESPLSLTEAIWGLRGFLAPVVHPLSAGPVQTFSLVPGVDAIFGKTGRIAYTSAIGSDTTDVIGDPLAALGITGATPGTFETATSTLTIPIESAFTVGIDTGHIVPGTHVYVTNEHSGQIVAVPIPEPSPLVLLGFGLAGLLAYRWRARRQGNELR